MSSHQRKYSLEPREVPRVETPNRRILTRLPVPESLPILLSLERFEPSSMQGQPPLRHRSGRGMERVRQVGQQVAGLVFRSAHIECGKRTSGNRFSAPGDDRASSSQHLRLCPPEEGGAGGASPGLPLRRGTKFSFSPRVPEATENCMELGPDLGSCDPRSWATCVSVSF